MFVKGAAVISEFETVDGLLIEIAVRVTDVRGSADLVAGNVIDLVQEYVADYDEAWWRAAEEAAAAAAATTTYAVGYADGFR